MAFLQLIQPSVEILGIRIDEPVTTLTDLVLAGVCFYAFFRIRRLARSGKADSSGTTVCFEVFFISLGLGALFGGLLGHGFLYGLAPPWKLLSWVLLLLSVASFIQALLWLVRALVKPRVYRTALWLNLLFLVVAIIFTVKTIQFSPVKYYFLFGMFLVGGPLSYFIFRRTGNRGMIPLMLAISLALPTAFIFSFKWAISPWFNHNDISHLILIFCTLIIYRGAVMTLASDQGQ
jgi:hypothetical protein